MRPALAIALLLTVLTVRSQSGFHLDNQYTIKEGLSNNIVNCLVKDSRGFLWIGTNEGLNRFDGFQFKKIYAEKNDLLGLFHNNIFDIEEYQPGQLLIATSNGLSVFNSFTNHFENEKIQYAPFKPGSGTTITNLYKDPDGNIWVNSNGELDILDSSLHYLYRFTDLEWAKSLKGILIRFEKCFTDQQQRLWLPADQSSLAIVDFKAKKVWHQFNNPEGWAFLKKTHIRSFFVDDKNQTLWYAPWGIGVIRYDFKTKKEEEILFGMKEASENRTINSIIQTENGNLLCAGSENIYEINPSTLAYKEIFEKKMDDDNNSVFNNTLLNSFSSGYWAGTTQGLLNFSNKSSVTTELPFNNSREFKTKECTDLVIGKSGSIYASYYNNSLVVVDRNRITNAVYHIQGVQEIHLTEVCEDLKGIVWVGTNQGLYQFDPSTHHFSKPAGLPSALADSIINVIYCDEENTVWVGTRSPFTLYKYDAIKKSYLLVDNPVLKGFKEYSKENRISQITSDGNHNLWMISQLGGGILCHNLITGSWKNYGNNSLHKKILAQNGLMNIYADNQQNLWLFEVQGNGLIRYQYQQDSISYFKRTEGLQSDYIQNICSDQTKNLWVITEYGVSKFNPEQFTVINTAVNTVNYSLYPFQECIYDPFSNSLVYGLNNRLLFFNTAQIVSTPEALYPIVDNILVNNQSRYINPLVQQLQLQPDEKNISISFTTVHLNNSGKIRFAYQMVGADKDWKTTEDIRTASYSSLAPGNYTFRLKVAYENDNWSKSYDGLKFTIAPPFWQTWWFILSSIAGLVLSIILLFQYRIRSVRKEAILKQTIASTEMMALRAQMNPHFIFNCLNSIDNLIQSDQKEKATNYLAKFAQLIRAILENSKNNTIPCWKDIEALQLYLEMEKLRWDDKIECTVTISPEIQEGDYKVPPMVVQPYIENAIHHGLLNKRSNDRKLSIDVQLSENNIKYTIIDNGVGREKAAAYKKLNKLSQDSMGMQITNDRINLFNGSDTHSVTITDLYSANHLPEGTRVEVWLTTQPLSI